MKLRLQANSVRLRLKQSEVECLVTTGLVEEAIVLGKEPDQTFDYVLEASGAVTEPNVSFKNNGLVIQLPYEWVTQWASGQKASIEVSLPVASRLNLQVLIEKDFACLDKSAGENADTFPNPLVGAKC